MFDRFTGQEKSRVRLGARISGPFEQVNNKLMSGYGRMHLWPLISKRKGPVVSRPQPKGITIFGQAQPTFDRKNEQVILGFLTVWSWLKPSLVKRIGQESLQSQQLSEILIQSRRFHQTKHGDCSLLFDGAL